MHPAGTHSGASTVIDPAPSFPAELPRGVRARRPDLDRDAAGITEVARAYTAAYVGRPTSPPEEVLADLELHRDTVHLDSWLIEEAGPADESDADESGADDGPADEQPADGRPTDGRPGRIVAVGYFFVHDPDPAAAVGWIDVWTHPDWAGRLEGPLVDALMERARAVKAERGITQLRTDMGFVREDHGTRDAAAGRGLTHLRTFWTMERPLDADLLEVGPPPPGVTVRRVTDDAAGRELVYRLVSTAFRDHWGNVERAYDEWWKHVEAGVGVDTTQWWVAELDGAPVAIVMGDTSRATDPDAPRGGFIADLGVLREGRRRGIARHLLYVAFAEHAARGWTFTQLGVDSSSPTGANHLYASVGMSPIEIVDVYARLLDEA